MCKLILSIFNIKCLQYFHLLAHASEIDWCIVVYFKPFPKPIAICDLELTVEIFFLTLIVNYNIRTNKL